MEKPKAGLHKKISSIFDGVPVPKPGEEQQLSQPAAANFKGHIPPRPQIPPRMPQTPPSRPPEPDIFPQTLKHSISEYVIEKLAALKLQQFADKQKIKILIVPLLAIILIFVLYWNFAGSSQLETTMPEAGNVKGISDVVTSASAIVWQKPEPYPVYMRDPTQVSAAGAYMAGTGSIAVGGIVYSADNPSAVIGNEIVHEGDTIGGVTILKINQDSVEFTSQGKVWTQKVK